ncbi:MAG: flagellar basal body-associated FliL family protein [Proteobacteria bacterium]|nr:flagellar basal body-associated FliL family protein [Pseudomonadota bacterium]
MFFKKKPKPEAEGEAAPPVDGEGGEGEGPAKKKLPIMLIVIGLAGVLVLGGGGAGAYFMFLAPKGPPDKAAAEKDKKKKEKKKGGEGGEGGSKKADPTQGVVKEGPDGITYFTMPDLVVNIQSADGKPTYLKLKLTLEMRDPETADLIQESGPRMQDMFTTFLRELRPEDLSGSQGSFQLRQEILRRVNLVLAPKKVDAVDIEEMLIQ